MGSPIGRMSTRTGSTHRERKQPRGTAPERTLRGSKRRGSRRRGGKRGAARRGRWLTAALVGVVVVILAVLVGSQLMAAQTDLLAGRASVEQAREALTRADLTRAQGAFADASAHFTDADVRLSRPAMRVLAGVPFLGNNVQTARALARAGVLITEAGDGLAAALAEMPEGVGGLAPREGSVPIELLAGLAEPLEGAQARVAEAHAVVTESPTSGLLQQVADAREEFTVAVGPAVDGLTTAAVMARHLPAFLGADGPRRYFVGAQNPAEARGTGGLIGAFGILTVDGGRIDVGAFQSIGILTEQAPDDLPPPNEDYQARYGEFSATVHGSNINMTPDMPSAATALENLYTAATGEPVDGTILADPYLMEAMLEAIGPTDIPGVGEVHADTVVDFLSQDQYGAVGEGDNERKEVLGDVAGEVLRRFMRDAGSRPEQAIAALGKAVADGRLQLHAADPDVQQAFAAINVHGALAAPQGDLLAVIVNNSAANKLDAFMERRVTYDVHLQPDGSARARTTVDLTNNAPTSGLHQDVIGPNVPELEAGQNRTWLSVYCAAECELVDATRNGAANEGLDPKQELGHPVFSTLLTMPSDSRERLQYWWDIPRAWQKTGGEGAYRLTVRGQPTLPPTPVTVRIHPPDGMRVLSGPEMPGSDGVVTWAGQPGTRVELEVLFERSVPALVARSVRETFNRPLLDLVVRRED